ncbi:hypothetical protein [Nostoc sp. CALU 546]|uniref:hypothetical protein n=1 Tax=Nostoc sp. CALU 546 TaxID=1867241 RepID=UPI003B67528B
MSKLLQKRRLLQERTFYSSEPIAYLLIEKFRLSPLPFGLVSIAISTGLALLTAWVSDTLWSKPQQVGLLQSLIPWIALIFFNPILLGYYLWSFQAINNLIQELKISNVIETDNPEEIDLIALNPYYQRWRRFIALGSAISFSIFVFYTRFGLDKTWSGSGLLPNLVTTVGTFVIAYMGTVLVLNLITNIWVLHHILGKKKLNVNPLHPDRCGGLRSLSHYSLKTAYLAAVFGIWVGAVEYQFITQGSWRENWFVHFIIPLYIVLSITCFFGPLFAAHNGMEKAKVEFLHQIARQFQAAYSEIHICLTEDSETLKQRTEKIQQLRTLYTMTDEFPVWPFDVQTFRRYLVTVPTPLIPPLIGLLQKFLVK